MRRLVFLLLAGCAIAPAVHAETCPWLNAATAGGVLGSEAKVEITHAEGALAPPPPGIRDTTCVFTPASAGKASSLSIAVHTMNDHGKDFAVFAAMCPAAAAIMAGVGNQAFACELHDASGAMVDQVVGRVRERAFVIRWQLTPEQLAHAARMDQTSASLMQNLAEQVAGSMF